MVKIDFLKDKKSKSIFYLEKYFETMLEINKKPKSEIKTTYKKIEVLPCLSPEFNQSTVIKNKTTISLRLSKPDAVKSISE